MGSKVSSRVRKSISSDEWALNTFGQWHKHVNPRAPKSLFSTHPWIWISSQVNEASRSSIGFTRYASDHNQRRRCLNSYSSWKAASKVWVIILSPLFLYTECDWGLSLKRQLNYYLAGCIFHTLHKYLRVVGHAEGCQKSCYQSKLFLSSVFQVVYKKPPHWMMPDYSF